MLVFTFIFVYFLGPIIKFSKGFNKEACGFGYDDQSGMCIRCGYTFYRYSLEGDAYFNSDECVKKDSSHNLTRSYWVSNKSCSGQIACDGGENTPFDSILKALIIINLETLPYLYSTINLYLLGQDHYALIGDLMIANIPAFFFDGVLTDIRISPWYCEMGYIEGCYESWEEKAHIIIKTNEFHIFYSYRFEIANLTIDGIDMHIQAGYDTNNCYNQKQICCTESNLNAQYDVCYINRTKYSGALYRPNAPGLFNSGTNVDQPFKEVPILKITGCIIKNIYAMMLKKMEGFYTFLRVFELITTVQVTDTLFNNTFFEQNLVKTSNLENYYGIAIQADSSLINGVSLLSFENSIISNYNIYEVDPDQRSNIYVFYLEAQKSLQVNLKGFIFEKLGAYNQGIAKTILFLLINIRGLELDFVTTRSMGNHAFIQSENTGLIIGRVFFSQMVLIASESQAYFYVQNSICSIELLDFENVIVKSAVLNTPFFIFISAFLSIKEGLLKNGRGFNIIFFMTYFEASKITFFGQSLPYAFAIIASSTIKFFDISLINVNLNYLHFLITDMNYDGSELYFGALNIQKLIFLKNRYLTRFIHWPSSHNYDKLTIQKLYVDSIEGFYFSFIDLSKMNFLEICEASFSNVFSYLKFINIYNFNTMRISNLSLSDCSLDDYFFTIECKNCFLLLFNFTVKDITINMENPFFFKIDRTVFQKISVSSILLEGTTTLFSLGESSEISIADVNIDLKDSVSLFGFEFYFDISDSDLVLLSNCLLISNPNSNLGESGAILFFLNKYVSVNNLKIIDHSCPSSIKGNFFRENGIMPFLGSTNYLAGDDVLLVSIMDFTILNCKFCSNGVVAFLAYAQVDLKNFYFHNCSSFLGGTLFIRNTNQVLLNSVYIEVSEAYRGGAIYSNNVSSLHINDFKILETLAYYGGALALFNSKNVSLTNFIFLRGHALSEGGTIYSTVSSLSLKFGQIINSVSDREGGALYMSKGDLIIIENLEAKILSAESGGFLFATECLDIRIQGMAVEKSSVTREGSAFRFEDCGSVKIDRLNLTANNVTVGVGTVFGEGTVVNKYEFSNVICKNCFALDGSCFQFYTSYEVTIQDSVLSENIGTTISIISPFITMRAKLTLLKVNLINNNIEESDNVPYYVIYGEKTDTNIEELNVTDNWFKNSMIYFSDCESKMTNISISLLLNKSFTIVYYPTFLELTRANIVLHNITFENRKFNLEMAVLYSHSSEIRFSESNFHSCFTTDWSCVLLEKSNVILAGLKFNSCKGIRSGAIFSYLSNISLANCLFQNNKMKNFSPEILDVNDIYLFQMNSVEVVNSQFLSVKGVSIYSLTGKTINFTRCEFESAANEIQTKALYLVNTDIFNIIKTFFQNYNSYLGGCIYVDNKLHSSSVKIDIERSHFLNCSSAFGGVFYLVGPFGSILIRDNSFEGNSAFSTPNIYLSGKGGVGYIIAGVNQENKAEFLLSGNVFKSNIADLFGPNLISQITITHKDSYERELNEFINNTDSLEVSSDLIYFPLNLQSGVINTDGSEEFYNNINGSLQLITSGKPFKFMVTLTDFQGNLLNFENYAKAILAEVPDKNRKLFWLEGMQSKCLSGVCIFDNVKVRTKPDSNFSLSLVIEFDSSQIFPEGYDLLNIQPTKINFFSRACIIGELIATDQSCSPCPSGKYSISDPTIPNLKCSECPANSYCSGGSKVTPLAGFWRDSVNSTLILECISKKSCLGFAAAKTNDELIHGACEAHQFGRMCYSCEKGYARLSQKDVCKICSESNVFLYFKLVIALLGIILYITFQVNLTFKANSGSHAGILMKQFVNHFQQVGMISLVDLGWTPDIKSYFAIQEYFTFISEEFINIDCFLTGLGYNILTQKIVFGNILPILLSILTLVLWIISFYLSYLLRRAKVQGYQRVFDQARVSVMIIVYLLFPEILRKSFGLLNCVFIEDVKQTKVLMFSPEVVCWEDEHIKYLLIAALPGLIVWGLVTPLFLLFLLRRYKIFIVANIKAFRKRSSIEFQSSEALQALEELRSTKVHVNSLEEVKKRPQDKKSGEGAIQRINTFVKRNNFFNRKFLQENSISGPMKQNNFLKLNSLDGLNRGDSFSKEVLGGDRSLLNQDLESTFEYNHEGPKSEGLLEKITRKSINIIKQIISPATLSTKEERKIRKENGLMLKFIYRGYSARYYYWEMVMFSKKFFLIFISSFNDFFPSNTKSIVLLIVLSIYVLLQTKYKPFEADYLNKIEFTSLVVSFLTANMGIMLFTDDLKKVDSVFLIFIVFFNGFFIFLWASCFYKQVIKGVGLRSFVISLFNLKKIVKSNKILAKSN